MSQNVFELEERLPTKQEIWDCPWHFSGLRSYSYFLDSDNEYMIFRKFGKLNARILLSLQDSIARDEEALKTMDDEYSRRDAPRSNNGSFREDIHGDRRALISALETKLHKYNTYLLTYSQLREKPPVPARQVQYIKNWHITNEGAIKNEEKAYLDSIDDLIPLAPTRNSPLRTVLSNTWCFGWSSFFRREPSDKSHYDEKTMYLENNARLSTLVSIIICFVGLSMLIAPLWILNVTDSSKGKLGVITAFVVVFFALVEVVTNARPIENLGATAAYAAVLVVFLQNKGSGP